MGSIYLGTSGWRHRQWEKSFYPDELDPESQLSYYAIQFGCVEIAESFFRLPERHTFAGWVEHTPEHFRLTVRAPRIITHYKKLKSCENQLDTLFTRLRNLGPKNRSGSVPASPEMALQFTTSGTIRPAPAR